MLNNHLMQEQVYKTTITSYESKIALIPHLTTQNESATKDNQTLARELDNAQDRISKQSQKITDLENKLMLVSTELERCQGDLTRFKDMYA